MFTSVTTGWPVPPAQQPVAFAAVVGAHFLPFQWIYRTRLYGLLGVVVAVGPFVLAVMFGERAMHYTGFFVGSALLAGALAARSHARATWLESRQAVQQSDAADAAPRRD